MSDNPFEGLEFGPDDTPEDIENKVREALFDAMPALREQIEAFEAIGARYPEHLKVLKAQAQTGLVGDFLTQYLPGRDVVLAHKLPDGSLVESDYSDPDHARDIMAGFFDIDNDAYDLETVLMEGELAARLDALDADDHDPELDALMAEFEEALEAVHADDDYDSGEA